MHDPSTLICSINIPLPWKTETFWKDKRKEWAKYHLANLWHVDPCTDHSDDSCGWFMRARHGNKEVLEKIVKRFAEDWDRVYKPSKQDHDPDDGEFVPKVYHCGLFKPNGDPHLSVQAIALNLFYIAAIEYLKSDGLTNWKKAKRFLRKTYFDIVLFAENPTDSLFDTITRKFEKGCGEEYTARAREERIRNMASTIYAWILRHQRPWYSHPRWHVWHWKLQVIPLQKLNRWLFSRCAKCGKRFSYNESPIGSWSGTQIWHQACDGSQIKDTDKKVSFSMMVP